MKRFTFIILLISSIAPMLLAIDKPQLQFQKIIGDMRGRSIANYSVAVADDGKICLLTTRNRVAIFDSKGKYLKTLSLTGVKYGPKPYLEISGTLILIGDYKVDYPWIFDPRRQGNKPGSFRESRMATIGSRGKIYVADRNNRRIQVFSPKNYQIPVQIIPIVNMGGPIAVAVRKNRLAVVTDQQKIAVYQLKDKQTQLLDSAKIPPGCRSVAICPDGNPVVAFSTGPDRHQLIKYTLSQKGLKKAFAFAPSYEKLWPEFFPGNTALITGPKGGIWFPSNDHHGAVLRLDPKTDKIKEVLKGLSRPTAVHLNRKQQLMVAERPRGKKGPIISIYENLDSKAPTLVKTFPEKGPLYVESNVPVWGFLPDGKGGIYCRLLETGWRKGWPAFTIKHIDEQGNIKTVYDFGSAYAKRTKFGPWAAKNTLEPTKDGNLILTSKPTISVMKITPKGKVIWEAANVPSGGANQVEFGCPSDIALDNKGRIWGVDEEKNFLFCLSPEGKLLLKYGKSATWDDLKGEGFSGPSGIAITEIDGDEFLYVGDAGNKRLVKYKITRK